MQGGDCAPGGSGLKSRNSDNFKAEGTPAVVVSRSLAFLIGLTAACSAGWAEDLSAPGIEAPGGRRIVVRDGDLRREFDLLGVSLPAEGVPERRAGEAFIRDWVIGKNLRLSVLPGTPEGTAAVYSAAWVCLNEELIRAGLAVWDHREDSEGLWAEAEIEARKGRRGIWSADSMEGIVPALSLAQIARLFLTLRPDQRQELVRIINDAEGVTPEPTPPASLIRRLEIEIGHERSPGDGTAVIPGATTQKEEAEYLVYISRSGKRYHRPSCTYADRGTVPVSRKRAMERGMTPCRVCRP